jgi:hypothetical protein
VDREPVTQEQGGIPFGAGIGHDEGVFNGSDRTAASRASKQLGLVATQDLLDAGLTRSGITRRIEKGLLLRRRAGVYTFAGTPDFPAQRLVEEALSVDAKAVISHDSAAFLWSLVPNEPKSVHVVVRRWRREHRTTATVHESLDLSPKDRILRNGIPTTTAVRTVVDLGATSPWLVESAVSNAIRQKLFDVGDLEQFVGRVARRGRRGVGAIRPILELHKVLPLGTESVLEDRFARLLFERDIRLPMAQYIVLDGRGSFVCRADFAYPDQHLLIELDGRSYHSDRKEFQADRSKQNRALEVGWHTLRFTWDDVTSRPDFTAATVHRMLTVLA